LGAAAEAHGKEGTEEDVMMTAIEMLQVAGLVVSILFARAALVVVVVMALSLPLMAFAYTARGVQVAWHRHHELRHAHRHA
jgi:hypothetical protein